MGCFLRSSFSYIPGHFHYHLQSLANALIILPQALLPENGQVIRESFDAI